MDSILDSIKKLLGIDSEYNNFDMDIIIHINSVFMILTQLGVGPSEGFAIKSNADGWDELLPDDSPAKIEAIKSYVYLKVKLLFDPPLSSAAIDSVNRLISELEWRINLATELPVT